MEPLTYLDTSVLGGCFDDEFKEATQELWRRPSSTPFAFRSAPCALDCGGHDTAFATLISHFQLSPRLFLKNIGAKLSA